MRLQGGARAGDGGRVPREDTVGTPRGWPQREGGLDRRKARAGPTREPGAPGVCQSTPRRGPRVAGAASGGVCAVGARLLF